ncbi:MAG: hypothetical protein JWL73_1370 [Actinomycetia bacterium]|nr:hypothetical protein [Actinomycetes bacterium]
MGTLVVAGVMVAAGCAGGGRSGGQAEPRGWIDGRPTNGPAVGADRKYAAGAAPMTTIASPGDAAARSGTVTMTEGAPSQPAPDPSTPPTSGALRAGSVDDNQLWADYLAYRQQALATGLDVHDVDVTGRVVVSVVDHDGHPVLGATVQLVPADGGAPVATTLTHADGRAYLFPPAPSGVRTQREQSQSQSTGTAYRVQVALGSAQAAVPVAEAGVTKVQLDGATTAAPKQLDVLFCVDTTGSMGDEIEQLKANMVSIADRIATLPVKPEVHFALTVFRDRGDAYVTRTFDFTGNVTDFTDALGAISAQGGGDTPESVNAALDDAIHKPAWRGADTVKLLFLVGDAAPHLDYAGDSDYAKEVFEAAKAGIVIDPIASSGLGDQGEYIFRQLAELTGGRFTFLTYGPAGAPEPGDTTTHHVRDYSVLSLDDLVVRLVSDTMTNGTGAVPTAPSTTTTTTTTSQNYPVPPGPAAVPGTPSGPETTIPGRAGSTPAHSGPSTTAVGR